MSAADNAPAPSQTVTWLDIVKSLAVLIMLCDHVGYYLFPDQEWWRAVGRIGMPVWFVMAGWSGIGVRSILLWGSALALVKAGLGAPLPLNALIAIAAWRFVCWTPFTARLLREPGILASGVAVWTLLIPWSNSYLEYGLLGFLFALSGRAMRDGVSRPTLYALSAWCYVVFCITQMLSFGFSVPATAFMMIGTLGVMAALLWLPLKAAAAHPPRVIASLVRFMGHRTLEIYVVHIPLLMIAARLLS